MRTISIHVAAALLLAAASTVACGDDMKLELRSQVAEPNGAFKTQTRAENWLSQETAVIVCDVWDLHHSINAVRRMQEFLPRMNEVIARARQQGSTIIHAPSDCMPAYAEHPARLRAIKTPSADNAPERVDEWCSRIPAERNGIYPIDQSDGGEDDDPREHAEWAAKLKALGRNPGMPWQKQNDQITIDAEHDYISDRGDEVWNILAARGIKNVILLGVHTNMCVLGRPFGLRRMVLGQKNVVLMRDMTDCMYNPKSWPYVSHYAGNRLIVDHVERFICPTITSGQLLGGEPFRSTDDMAVSSAEPKPTVASVEVHRRYWSLTSVPAKFDSNSQLSSEGTAGPGWYRCAIRIPKNWHGKVIRLSLEKDWDTKAWFNGQPLTATKNANANEFEIQPAGVTTGDMNLLVLRVSNLPVDTGTAAPKLRCDGQSMELAGRWQFRARDDEKNSNMPLPAKFGAPPDIVFDQSPSKD